MREKKKIRKQAFHRSCKLRCMSLSEIMIWSPTTPQIGCVSHGHTDYNQSIKEASGLEQWKKKIKPTWQCLKLHSIWRPLDGCKRTCKAIKVYGKTAFSIDFCKNVPPELSFLCVESISGHRITFLYSNLFTTTGKTKEMYLGANVQAHLKFASKQINVLEKAGK